MMEAGGTAPAVALAYQADHPLEPIVTADEIAAALAEASANRTRAVPPRAAERSTKTGIHKSSA